MSEDYDPEVVSVVDGEIRLGTDRYAVVEDTVGRVHVIEQKDHQDNGPRRRLTRGITLLEIRATVALLEDWLENQDSTPTDGDDEVTDRGE